MKKYTALTQNMFRHLARGEEVQYGTFQIRIVEDKIVVRGAGRNGRQLELHYRRRPGNDEGFSKGQFKSIFASREKPLFSVSIRSRDAGQRSQKRAGRL
jgi:hypothetical protein